MTPKARKQNAKHERETPLAVIYTRVSTEDLALAKGWHVAEVYTDDLSGTLDVDERPGLRQMIDAAGSGAIDAVLVFALDRLARKTMLVLSLVAQLDACGVELVSVKESLDTSTPSGRFTLTIFAALAEMERDTIVARTTDGRNQRGQRDGERGGAIPLGYNRIRDGNGRAIGVEVVDPEAAIVRRIFALRSTGAALRAIADELNADSAMPRRGAKWYASTVREVLDNADCYHGGRRGESEETWPAILPL